MTTIEITVRPSTETKTEEQIAHYVCCTLPDNFCGFTMTFCGLSILMDAAADKEELSNCPQCVEVAKRPGCPLGHDCWPED